MLHVPQHLLLDGGIEVHHLLADSPGIGHQHHQDDLGPQRHEMNTPHHFARQSGPEHDRRIAGEIGHKVARRLEKPAQFDMHRTEELVDPSDGSGT